MGSHVFGQFPLELGVWPELEIMAGLSGYCGGAQRLDSCSVINLVVDLVGEDKELRSSSRGNERAGNE